MLRRTPQLLRACAAALAVLWLALPLVELLHVGEHAHRFCAEHHAFEKLEGEAPQAPSLAAREAERGAAEALESAAGTGEAHEQCPLAWAEPRRAWRPASESIPLTGEPRALRPFRGAVWPGAAVPLLALAPKASPPGR
jgi:hypothetical protein